MKYKIGRAKNEIKDKGKRTRDNESNDLHTKQEVPNTRGRKERKKEEENIRNRTTRWTRDFVESLESQSARLDSRNEKTPDRKAIWSECLS